MKFYVSLTEIKMKRKLLTLALLTTILAMSMVVSLAKASDWCEIGVPYRAVDGLTVTLNSCDMVEKTGSYEYTITYTLENENLDEKILEGAFKMYYRDTTGGLPQYGFFDYLFPSDTITRSYTFEELKSKPFDVLEYHHDNFFSDEPLEDSLKWNDTIIPEFQSAIILLLTITLSTLAIIFAKKKLFVKTCNNGKMRK